MPYFHIDHKTPKARGGSESMSNKQLLCSPCNTRKGDKTDGDFRRVYKLTPSREAKGPPSKVIPQSYFEEISKAVGARKAKARAAEKRNDWLGAFS